MYQDFYGFLSKPFQLSPDPRFFFNSSGHARAMAYLEYGIQQGEGFVVVTGEVGTGKTTLARLLHEQLSASSDVVIGQLVLTSGSGEDLLRMVADAFGIEHEGRTRATVLRGLVEMLQRERTRGRRVLLLIDEAQNLSFEALEKLRMLSNLQAEGSPLLQCLLLGQAEFNRTLQGPDLEQLRQRVIASCHLSPLRSAFETRHYVEHRLKYVGWVDDPAIGEGVYERIHEITGGIPRRINTFCDRLLLYGFLEQLHAIAADTVDAVAGEIAADLQVQDEPVGTNGAARGEPDGERVARLEARVAVLEQALRWSRDGLVAGLEQGERRLREEGPAPAAGEGALHEH